MIEEILSPQNGSLELPKVMHSLFFHITDLFGFWTPIRRKLVPFYRVKPVAVWGQWGQKVLFDVAMLSAGV